MQTRKTSPDGKENRVTSKDIGNGGICKYQLEFPTIAAEYDRLILKVTNVTNAQVYAVQTLAFSSSTYVETILTADTGEIKVSYPYLLYLTVVADFTFEPTTFEATYWFENRDPETLTEEEKIEDTLTQSIVPPKEVIVIQEKKVEIYETSFFWILAGGLLLALIVGIVCCFGLVNMKRKNDRISTKIQMLTDLKRDSMHHSGTGLVRQPTTKPVVDDVVVFQENQNNGLTKEQ